MGTQHIMGNRCSRAPEEAETPSSFRSSAELRDARAGGPESKAKGPEEKINLIVTDERSHTFSVPETVMVPLDFSIWDLKNAFCERMCKIIPFSVAPEEVTVSYGGEAA